MGYLDRRFGGGVTTRQLYRTPLFPKTQTDFGAEVSNPFRGYQEFFGFPGSTGSAFISTIRKVQSAEPYPARLSYRNDLLRPVNLRVFIERPDGSTKDILTEDLFPPLGSFSKVFIGPSAIQAGSEAGRESVRIEATPVGLSQLSGSGGESSVLSSVLNNGVTPVRDEFFREVLISPPPDAPPVRGGNAGGAAVNRNADGGGFPTPPSIGGFPVYASGNTWDSVAPTFDGIFQQFSVSHVTELERLDAGINFAVNAGGDISVQPIKDAIAKGYPGRSTGLLFQKPPTGGNIFALPANADETFQRFGTPIGTDYPVYILIDATSVRAANRLLGRFGTQLRLPPQDPQWTFIKAADLS